MKPAIRNTLVAIALAAGCAAPTAFAQVSFSFNYNVPGANIGLNLGGYPALQPIPGYPVYYAPGVNGNYFFYDGMYWVFDGNNWYASNWYNGPWALVDPYSVPLYVLRVPVRYYRHAPAYFHGWRADAPPRWGDHYGRGWEERHRGWDHWDHRQAPRPAPLPTYQREYRGDRYPQNTAQQQQLHENRYRYQPRDEQSQRHYQDRRAQAQQVQQQAPAQYQRGPGNSDYGHQQGQGHGREHAPGQQGRQAPQAAQPAQHPHGGVDTRSETEKRPASYSGG